MSDQPEQRPSTQMLAQALQQDTAQRAAADERFTQALVSRLGLKETPKEEDK
jgi:hypothetical protein